MSSKSLEGLNAEQLSAVTHTKGPLLILAGAGSGKTTVLVARSGHLLETHPGARLCVLTFTNKAARELKARVAKRLGTEKAKSIWAGTFHSFGVYLLKRFYKEARLPKDFGILDSTDANAQVKELLGSFQTGDKTAFDPDRVLNLLTEYRESGVTAARKEDDYEEAAEWLLPKYLKRLEHLGMVDFDSLILKPIELMKNDPAAAEWIQSHFDYVMVDEFQDTNVAQMRLLNLLVKKHGNIGVVGDDDQSIYGWRGACIENILDFPKYFPGCHVVKLEKNYRSTPAILNFANAAIAKNAKRHDKQLRPHRLDPMGSVPEIFVYETENEECENAASEISTLLARGIPGKEIAVLYRSNGQGSLLEAELRRLQIPYTMSGGTAFFDRKEVRDVLAYLRCSVAPNEVAFRRILNTPPRGIGEKTVEDLTEASQFANRSFFLTARRWREAGIDVKTGAILDDLFSKLSHLTPSLCVPGSGAKLLQWLKEVGYRAYLDKTSKDSVAAQKRWGLLEVFSGILDKFMEVGGYTEKALKDFLEAMELRDMDDGKDKDHCVQLLTLHACKGLEFSNVILMGVEEDLLPHKTLGSDLSEERRLFYVGVTRAKEHLILTRARKRRRHGKWIDSPPSRFLLELPAELYQEYRGGRPMKEGARKSMIADLFKKLDALETPPQN